MARYDGYLSFMQRFVDPILDGTKDVTRHFRPRHVDEILRAKVPNDRKLPSQWPGFATLKVVSCRSERLWALIAKEDEIHREGAADLEDFHAIWQGIYAKSKEPGKTWLDNPAVWRIQFKVVKRGKYA